MSGEQIGGKIRGGIDKAKLKFRADQKQLYDKAFDLVPDGASGRLNEVIKLRAELQKKIQSNPKAFAPFINPALKQIDELLENDGIMDLKIGRELRTAIRLTTDVTGPGGAVGVTKPQAQYITRIYKALSDDLNQIVKDKGGAEAQKAQLEADQTRADLIAKATLERGFQLEDAATKRTQTVEDREIESTRAIEAAKLLAESRERIADLRTQADTLKNRAEIVFYQSRQVIHDYLTEQAEGFEPGDKEYKSPSAIMAESNRLAAEGNPEAESAKLYFKRMKEKGSASSDGFGSMTVKE